MRDTIEMAREAGWTSYDSQDERFKAFAELVRADERMSFYGQDKPAECADGCPPNQICDYCQVVAPAKAMILAEREACAKKAETLGVHPALNVFAGGPDWYKHGKEIAAAIRARGNT
jgi:hypothetical protein